MPTHGHALIIGGSLGGLFAAHLLRAAGWRVDVFERSAEDLAGRGAGLGTHDALLRVLRRLGIDDGSALGVGTRYYVWFDADGEVASKLERPRIMTAWARLYRPLRDALPAQHYHPAKSLVTTEQDARGITAVFADGTRVTGDLLVAADGPRSTIRPQVLPQVRPDYAGYVAWRGLTAEPRSPSTARCCSRATRSASRAASLRCPIRCRRATAICGRGSATTTSSGTGRPMRPCSPISIPMRPGAAMSRSRRR